MFVSSLIIDRLCDQARGQIVTVACVYFDIAARRSKMLGAPLKQVVGTVLGELSQANEGARKGSCMGGRGP